MPPTFKKTKKLYVYEVTWVSQSRLFDCISQPFKFILIDCRTDTVQSLVRRNLLFCVKLDYDFELKPSKKIRKNVELLQSFCLWNI